MIGERKGTCPFPVAERKNPKTFWFPVNPKASQRLAFLPPSAVVIFEEEGALKPNPIRPSVPEQPSSTVDTPNGMVAERPPRLICPW